MVVVMVVGERKKERGRKDGVVGGGVCVYEMERDPSSD